jgi:ribosomal protein L11 methylase PrmA
VGAVRAEPGSFRDPDSRVFLTDDGSVLRALSAAGWEDWLALQASSAFAQLTDEGRLIGTSEANGVRPASVPAGSYAGVLRHERVPFVSYPYEWPFSMLRDAALLHLDILDRCLGESLILKDSSPYNVQWRGSDPVHIDIGSFERLREDEPWVGYRQFCELFLYPLMLQAYKGVPFQPWLRGSLEGIAPGEARALMSLRDRLRRGVLTHVVLHARLERRYEASSGREVKGELARAGFRPEIIRANVRRLRKLVARLRWDPGSTAWTGYREDNSYSEADADAKARFVAQAAARRPRKLAWDLGCNDGAFARTLAGHARTVVAMDADHATVDRLYRALGEEGQRGVLPLVIDLCNPSPECGWRSRERGSLLRRGRPDLTLCLALVHHLAITNNVPLGEIVAWLAELGSPLVVEFPMPDDPMVQRLLAGKREGAHSDYTREQFEQRLNEAFVIDRHEQSPTGKRVLYEAHPRAA